MGRDEEQRDTIWLHIFLVNIIFYCYCHRFPEIFYREIFVFFAICLLLALQLTTIAVNQLPPQRSRLQRLIIMFRELLTRYGCMRGKCEVHYHKDEPVASNKAETWGHLFANDSSVTWHRRTICDMSRVISSNAQLDTNSCLWL